jgi:transcriptional regulator with XRE-family HTH domain
VYQKDGRLNIRKMMDISRRYVGYILLSLSSKSLLNTGATVENEALKQALGKIILQLRINRGISQEKLALDAEVDRTRVGEIERGEANATIDTLSRIANVLGQKLGPLIVEAEELSSGVIRKIVPTVNPAYINRNIPLPIGITHDQLEKALNQALVILSQIGLNPAEGDIQYNIYSGAVSNIVTKAIAQVSDFIQNKDTDHPDLFNPNLDRNHPDWGLEMKASNQIAKGGESHNPGKGWFMIVIYQIVEGQTHIVQVEVAQLEKEDWTVHERSKNSNRTRTAVTLIDATNKLRRNSVYIDPGYLTPTLKRIIFHLKRGEGG